MKDPLSAQNVSQEVSTVESYKIREDAQGGQFAEQNEHRTV